MLMEQFLRADAKNAKFFFLILHHSSYNVGVYPSMLELLLLCTNGAKNFLPGTILLLCVCFVLCLSFPPQAASTPLNPLSFQCEFVKLRIDLLQAFSQLICTCNSLKTSPPPAIATTIAMTLGNDLQRCGRISNQVCLNFIFSAVFIYTLEVFEVSCEMKKPKISGLTKRSSLTIKCLLTHLSCQK